ncbi:MAG: alkaline phosphatase family protein [Candidatus Omnitrophica bacterium]|nr:alkaline phosphatase family protein [Candidatus Omnitrophota bacterium]
MFFGYIDPGSGFTIISLGAWFVALSIGALGVLLIFFKRLLGFFKRNFIVAAIALLLATATAIILIGVHMNKNASSFDKRIIILGFDGLSPQIIEPMMADGLLLNFSALKAMGSYGHLSTTNPPQSPVAWSAFATGQNPGKNGIFDFIVRDPEDYSLDLSLSKMARGKPVRVLRSKCFWEYASQKKVPSCIITAPVTFPPHKIYGRMLSGMGVPDILGTEGTFTFYTTEPVSKNDDVGGKVFQVKRLPAFVLDLIGPRVGAFGRAENIKVPVSVKLMGNRHGVIMEYQNRRIELKEGEWSDWQDVAFNISPFKKMKGIFKFYLVEASPDFKLYISPINFDPRDPYFDISYPRDYSKDTVREIGLYHTQGMPMDTWSVNEMRISEGAFIEQVNEVMCKKKALMDLEMGRFKKGVLFCYFESPDIVQHMFWRYTDPLHPLYEENAPNEYKNMIKTWYINMDKILGDAMTRLNKDDTLIVISDHGFDTFRRVVHINTWLKENGYLKLKDNSARSGRVLLEDIDWSNTKAYAIGFGAIYLNQRGREGKGVLAPGEESEALKNDISRKLSEWHDDKYDEKIVSRVYKREDIFRGEYADLAPDLYIGFNKGYRASWQTAMGGVPEMTLEDNLKKWSGSHLFDPALIPGIIFTNRVIIKKEPSIYDVAPTVLKTVGYSPEELDKCGLDGRPLF